VWSNCAMAVSRRGALLLGGGLFAASACARASHGGDKAPMQGSAQWKVYKDRFLDPSGRIVDNGNGGISHSEGQGYGLAFALWNNDHAAFARILDWAERVLARKDKALFSWRFDPRQPDPVADPNNATDADIFIAWVLANAARRWKAKAYADRSAAIRAAIRSDLVIERYGRLLLLPGLSGFVSPAAVTINPSYYVWQAIDMFRRLDGETVWGRVAGDGEALLGAARFGPLGLPADWVDVTGHDAVAPAAGRPPRFGYDAIRAPLYAWTGRRKWLAEPVRAWWREGSSGGRSIPAWIEVVTGEAAPYGLSEGGNAVAAKLLGRPAPDALSGDYYAASLQMLAAQLPS
jgi:endo-1,4-beta-D-glucanase Y